MGLFQGWFQKHTPASGTRCVFVLSKELLLFGVAVFVLCVFFVFFSVKPKADHNLGTCRVEHG